MCLCPVSFKAALHGPAASSNVSSFIELVDSLICILFGKLLLIDGRWLLFVYTYLSIYLLIFT